MGNKSTYKYIYIYNIYYKIIIVDTNYILRPRK